MGVRLAQHWVCRLRRRHLWRKTHDMPFFEEYTCLLCGREDTVLKGEKPR